MGKKERSKAFKALLTELAENPPEEASAEQTREVLLGLLDFCTVKGALIRAPQFVHYIEMARLELEHWRPTSPPALRPRPPSRDAD